MSRSSSMTPTAFPMTSPRTRCASAASASSAAGFDAAMAEQKAAARAAWKGSGEASDSEVWFDIADREGASEFTGYGARGRRRARGRTGARRQRSPVRLGRRRGRRPHQPDPVLRRKRRSGWRYRYDHRRPMACGLRFPIRPSRSAASMRTARRSKLARSASATPCTLPSIRNGARRSAPTTRPRTCCMRRCAAGLAIMSPRRARWSGAERLRFDFSHPKPLTDEDIAAVEAEVNAEIRANEPVSTRLMTPDDAIAAGAMALFGEKYGDEVRVLAMGRADEAKGSAYSVELCGGIHVRATGDIGLLRIVSESAVSSGVRRIEALTGEGARRWLVDREDTLKQAASLLRTAPDEVASRLVELCSTSARSSSASWRMPRRRSRLAGGGSSRRCCAAGQRGRRHRRRQVLRPGHRRARRQGTARAARCGQAAAWIGDRRDLRGQ